MTLYDTTNYLLFNNPLSSSVISGLSGIARATGIKPKQSVATTKNIQSVAAEIYPPLWRLCGQNRYFYRISGLSGAAAVILGAYGAHKPFPECKDIDLKKVFETANRFHFFHSLALMAVPFAKRPAITGFLMITGTVLFCFPCYYRAFTANTDFNRIAPLGGFCLILAWLSMVL